MLFILGNDFDRIDAMLGIIIVLMEMVYSYYFNRVRSVDSLQSVLGISFMSFGIRSWTPLFTFYGYHNLHKATGIWDVLKRKENGEEM